MEYKYKEIGERISEERRKLIVKDKNGKERKCSQSEFINEIKDRGGSIGRNRLSAIENGERAEITLDELILMSDMFKCDIGYLLGEYTERNATISQISRITGLSENSINKLITLRTKRLYNIAKVIDFLLDKTTLSREDNSLLSLLSHYLNTPEKNVIDGLKDNCITDKSPLGSRITLNGSDLVGSALYHKIIQRLVEYRSYFLKKKNEKRSKK